MKRTFLLMAWLLGTSSWVAAVDHNNIDAGRPLSFDDAEAVAYRERTVEFGGKIVSPRKHSLGAQGAAELLYGFAHDSQVSLDVDPTWGSRSTSEERRFDVGDVGLGILHNFNREIKNLPAFAARGDVFFPSGRDTKGSDVRIRGILSKTICQYSRLHVNMDGTFRSDPKSGERNVIPALTLGWSKPIRYPRVFTQTLLAETGVRSSDKYGTGPIASVGLGLRQQVTVRSVFDIGIRSDVIGGRSAPRDNVQGIVGYSVSF
jgi:hypothetical protein